ncbi:hydroxyethylthiazole kinase [uncultured Sphaerochaeta sp.]|uniref:hydroxyethylthiazole kinase n=1 Tax=uncultured Sphaerochaeta sp. TaxID=886478 RepID=UPI002AA76FBA|nr:hydroxyethylthiazole kinase [uncultured Sphaerochaeta sp.]
MDTKQMYSNSTEILLAIRERKPIIHQITNYVTVQDCANVVLAMGGSPIMADAEQELEDIVCLSNALVINIGTLNDRTRSSMFLAARIARDHGIPIILDPVGAGASSYRTNTIQSLISDLVPTVIRGNLSEIRSVAQMSSHTLGVDSAGCDGSGQVEQTKKIAWNLSRKLGCIIAITGKIDIVSDGISIAIIENGHPDLTQITGTGCMSTAMVGTCCAVTNDYFSATVTALLGMGIAGELASVHAGLGNFHTALFDHFSKLDGALLKQRGNLYVK